MKIAVQSARILERTGIEGGFALYKKLGFEGMDFGIPRWFPELCARTPEEMAMEMTLEEVKERAMVYREAADKYGISFTQTHAVFPIWKEGDEEYNARTMERLHKSIALTAFLGSKYVVIHPAFRPLNQDRMSAEEEWALNRELYMQLVPTLKEYNVVCCLENLFNRGPEGMRFAAACSDFHDAAKWVDDLNALAGAECFGFCFDTGHCHLVNQNVRRALNLLGKRLKVLHIHDNDGSTDWHLAPYMGNLDWEGFIEGLRDIDYDGDLAFETFKVLDHYPPEMTKQALFMVAETGRYFKQRLGK